MKNLTQKFILLIVIFTFKVTVGQEEKINQLKEVIIKSYRTQEKISEIPASIQVIQKNKIQEQIILGKSLKEAIAVLSPSLDFASQGRTGYAQNMRGRSVLVMLNGVSLNSARNTSRQFDAINPFNIEKIEIISGANAVFGGGATGGIINIITKNGQLNKEQEFETYLGAKSGFNNDDLDFEIAQSYKGSGNSISGYLGIAYSKNKGMYDADKNPVMIDFKQTDFQYNQTIDILGNLNAKISEKGDIKVNLQYYKSEMDNNKWVFLGENFSGLKAPKNITIKNGADSDVTPKTERFFTNIVYSNRKIFGNQKLTFQSFYRWENLAFGASVTEAKAPAPLPLTYSSYIGKSNVYGSKITLLKEWDKLNLSYGIDYSSDETKGEQVMFDPAKTFTSGGILSKKIGTLQRYPDTRLLDLSGFIQVNLQTTEKLNLSGGLRFQNNLIKVDDFKGFQEQIYSLFGNQNIENMKGGNNHESNFLFNANALYKLNLKNQIWLRYSQGITIPDPAKTYGFGSYNLVGDTWKLTDAFDVSKNSIPAIKTNQFELGYRIQKTNGFNAQFSGFYALSDKTINVDKNLFKISLKEEKVRNIGFETSVDYTSRFGGFIGINALIMKTETKIDDWKKQSAILVNPNKLSGFLGWKNKNITVQTQLQHSFDYESDLDNSSLKGYSLVDLSSTIKLPIGRLSVGIQNLLNRQYTTFWGQRSVMFYAKPLGTKKPVEYFGRGRTFSIGYNIKF